MTERVSKPPDQGDLDVITVELLQEAINHIVDTDLQHKMIVLIGVIQAKDEYRRKWRAIREANQG